MKLQHIENGSNFPEFEFNDLGMCYVVRMSPFSRRWHRATLTVTRSQLADWHEGKLIQDAMPHLSADEREFLMTGITPSEWDATIKDDDEPSDPDDIAF